MLGCYLHRSIWWQAKSPSRHVNMQRCNWASRTLAVFLTSAPPRLQVKDWAPKIEGIVEWFGQLQEVDVEGVPPALRAEVEAENFLREDTQREYEHRWVGRLAGGMVLAGAAFPRSVGSAARWAAPAS